MRSKTEFIEDFIGKITSDRDNLAKDASDYEVWIDRFGNRYVRGKDGGFNMVFFKANGFTAKWGRGYEDNPTHNPYGNEIADIEITKRCAGIRNQCGKRQNCAFCYKSNTPCGDYMSIDTFKRIFDVLDQPKTMTQIAFGTGSSLLESENPDYWKIFDYAKEHGVTPNVTVADVDEEVAGRMADTFGACAVSYYPTIDKNRCYDSVQRIVVACRKKNRAMAVNVHALVSAETLGYLYELIDDYASDPRLRGMNAIVFLSLKQKGRGKDFNRVTDEQFKELIDKCFERRVPFGMDSCSANKFVKAIEGRSDFDRMMEMIEPCESSCYSLYLDCYGNYYPCSFMEKEGNWKTGIDVLRCRDFMKEVWNEERVMDWRKGAVQRMKCNGGCNYCPYYDV